MKKAVEHILKHVELREHQLFYRKKAILNLQEGKKKIERGEELLSSKLYSEFYCTGGRPTLQKSNRKRSPYSSKRPTPPFA